MTVERLRLITDADIEREMDSLGSDEGVAQCPTCEGDGCSGTFYLDGSPQPCPTCSGGGIVRAPSEVSAR